MTVRTHFLMAWLTLWLGCSTAFGATLTAAELAPNSLVITEYLANPVGVSDADGEYFEVFNNTQHHLDLDGLIVRDDGSNAFTISSLLISPYSFAVLSSSDGATLGLNPDYVYGSGMTLTNTDDEIGLFRPDDALISKISYSDGDQFGAGIAHELATLNSMTPTSTFGPTLGTDFVAATQALALGNTGSPGSAGNTTIDIPAVPLPAGIWMLLSALSMLGWSTRRRPANDRPSGDRNAHSPRTAWNDTGAVVYRHTAACAGGVRR